MPGHALYLGVDGGGTKTRFALIDGAGTLLAQTQLGTAYHPQVGLDGVRRILEEGIATVLAPLQRGREDIAQAFFGLPAYGEDRRATAALDLIPGQVLGHQRYACDNDMVCGWAGSLACADGINIIAGTGSMGYGRRGAAAARAGGWGEAFGDEGSAHWIATQGLNAFSRMSDGRLPRGPLHAILRAHFDLDDDLDLCAHVYGEGVGTRGDIARLSVQVAQAADAGDAVAIGIFQQAGEELARIAQALRVLLGFVPDEPVPLSYSGGAFSAGALLMQPFQTALARWSEDFVLRTPIHPPHYGAALYALQLAGAAAR
ncbi:N-acetylglucosamine kinase [Pseudoxanthomonas winnipegensis]|uniref:N-acetylglucosamine kinase n=1 Tax=Pseudoxanthomonas winnipegensis TaxID=2480810 RepID=A0A4Q8LRB6_9GAMM|nr:BadF/BadG/BcrA/BcrD ATPase family protein [Pseudoxanthomonas winnipegensis]RZZ89205.1 N-acetylglucosamine kinase [Pseudoxanthomonas winnipegensis]TAA33346.1 N-acetylglucosamine kinase [Pseudoxanthomonas winnipegensis]TBV73331.1 N-acetylglucosamine kinase [Pseudoxanthomonas winnipegensis]